jgi:uncharacterized protein YegL
MDELQRRLKDPKGRYIPRDGGDVAEDIAWAMKNVMSWDDWKSNEDGSKQSAGQAQFVVLITDAPCHGEKFLNKVKLQQNAVAYDNRSNESDLSEKFLNDAFAVAIENNVSSMFCSCDPDATERTVKIMEGIAKNLKGNTEKKYFISTKMFEPKEDEHEDTGFGCHIVFVIDESGSMDGHPWNETVRAFNRFKQMRIRNQGLHDVVSIIQFNNGARDICTAVPLANASMGGFGDGGTSFAPAAERAKNVIMNYKGKKNPVVVFMTDGDSGDASRAHEHLRSIHTWSVNNDLNFQLHALAVGGGASMGNVQTLAGDIGKASKVQNFEDLGHVFVEICESTQACDTLYRNIGKQISDGVKLQIVDDFL